MALTKDHLMNSIHKKLGLEIRDMVKIECFCGEKVDSIMPCVEKGGHFRREYPAPANIPYYSSPSMSPETWGLVEKFNSRFALWQLDTGEEYEFDWYLPSLKISKEVGEICYKSRAVKAPTPTLAICRAFLAKED